MCHGHPRYHPCSHTSIKWYYCPAALIDLDTGVETPCAHLSYAEGRPTRADCLLRNCHYKALGGSWTCCFCNQGPNTKGWCTMPAKRWGKNAETNEPELMDSTCDHGCCADCTRSVPRMSASVSAKMFFPEPRKGTASRKFGYSTASSSHRRGSAVPIASGFPPMEEEVEEEVELDGEALSPSPTPSKSASYSESSSSSHQVDPDYDPKKHPSPARAVGRRSTRTRKN